MFDLSGDLLISLIIEFIPDKLITLHFVGSNINYNYFYGVPVYDKGKADSFLLLLSLLCIFSNVNLKKLFMLEVSLLVSSWEPFKSLLFVLLLSSSDKKFPMDFISLGNPLGVETF